MKLFYTNNIGEGASHVFSDAQPQSDDHCGLTLCIKSRSEVTETIDFSTRP